MKKRPAHNAPRSRVICLDLEGVLVPEIWIAVAKVTGIPELKRTTRDEPDYNKLMRYRISILNQHAITLPKIQKVIATMKPLPGAKRFLDEARRRYQVIILSDTFEQFASPLMKQLGWPTLFCHSLQVSPKGVIERHKLRQANGKEHAVKALLGLNFEVAAAGDSYNDLTMIQRADIKAFFRPPESIIKSYKKIPICQNYTQLAKALFK